MRMCFVVAITAVGFISAARAEPSGYVAAGTGVGLGASEDWLVGTVVVDAGLPSGSLVLHGAVETVARFVTGPWNQARLVGPDRAWYGARAGIEREWCRVDDVACFVAGVDLGYRTSRFDSNIYVLGRAGIDVGGPHVRFRSEAWLLLAGCGNIAPDDDCFFDGGLGLKLSVGYQW
jgi:hypothetical protein